jgi:hypothetical protein
VKTGAFPDLLLGHQNGQRNEATQCVNESGIQNFKPRGQVPQKVTKTDFGQKITKISKESLGSPESLFERGDGRVRSPEILRAIFLFKRVSPVLWFDLSPGHTFGPASKDSGCALPDRICSENSSTKNWLERVRRTE